MKSFLLILSFLAISVFTSCSSADPLELPPPPNPSSSSLETQNWCVYPSTRECFPTTSSECPVDGISALSCPYSSSSGVGNNYSSSGTGGDSSSSSGNGMSSSISSSSIGSSSSSSSGVVTSSSSTGSSSSISIQQGSVIFEGEEFIDTRDNNRYKWEIAPNGRVWMSENLRFSNGGTVGYCYKRGTEQEVLGTAAENGTGCNSPYGRNYTWETAMAGTSSQGLCPTGWRIPSPTEWNAIVGQEKMSKDFYVYSGNFNTSKAWPPLGWKDRSGDVSAASDARGYYWTTQNSGQDVTFAMMEPNYKVKNSDNFATRTEDYFSLRCIMDVPETCDGKLYNKDTHTCAGGIVYGNCNGTMYNAANQYCENGKVIDGGKLECNMTATTGTLEQMISPAPVVTCNGTVVSEGITWENNPPTSTGSVAVRATATCIGSSKTAACGSVSVQSFLIDGYKAVTIDGQIWMAEDLGGSNACGMSCPTGWRMPTEAEWESIITSAGGIGGLKAENGWGYGAGGGSDVFGITLLNQGLSCLGGNPDPAIWCSSGRRLMPHNYDSNYEWVDWGNSSCHVRCIKN